MTDQKNPRVRLVLCRSSKVVNVVLAALLAVGLVALAGVNAAAARLEAAAEAQRSQAALLEQENSRLKQQILELGTVQSIQQIAREELGLVDPDTVVMNPVQ